ncbi:ATP-binding protein [Frigidibacter sp. MR17.14]|uniref:ATP-binding protein n=1 Tax=Frigidibacter sp. MR17.14 TaxID=3126509 RepID=UPI003012ADD7
MKPIARSCAPWPRRICNLGLALVCGLWIGLTGVLAAAVVHQLRDLRAAASDNVQWTLSQVDVEFFRLRSALIAAERAEGRTPAALADLRKRTDILWSRLDTFGTTGTYAHLRQIPEFDANYRESRTALDAITAITDLADDGLAQRLAELDQITAGMEGAIRSLSLVGISEFAHMADDQREEMTMTLSGLAIAATAMLIAISLLAVSLLRLYRLSELRARDQALTSDRMQTVIQTSLDAIIVCDHDARVLDFSPAAEQIFGYTAEEAQGQDMLALILPPEAVEASRESLLRRATFGDPAITSHGRHQCEALRRDGRRFPSEIAVRTAEGEDERQIYILFLRDISLRKQAEAELTEALDRAVAGEKAKAEFVAVMSHEMRTPLNGLMGTLSLLKDTGLDPRQARYVATMETSGRLLGGLVNDVLDLSAFEAGKLRAQARSFRIDEVLDDVVHSQRHAAQEGGNRLDWRWEGPAPGMVSGDDARIRQVLLNFVGNAIKFTRDGEITLEAEMLSQDADGAQVEFRVIDTGTGIAQENLDRIFRDFEMLDSSYGRKAGTGLGLGISRRLAEVLGGEIGVESELGEGSLFWLRVPLDIPADEVVPEPAPQDDAPLAETGRALSVLIVEDNEINRLILREMVEAEGHTVTEAVDGREGVRRAAATRFDLILMDVSMPVLDGRDATRAIRNGRGLSREVPVVGVTAHALPEELKAFREAGMQEVLKKPIDRPALVRLLAAHAGDAPPPGPAAAAAPAAPLRRLFSDDAMMVIGAGTGIDRLRPLLGRFVEQADALMESLAGAGAAEGTATLQAIHRLAGSAATFGAERLHAELQAIETAAKRGDTAPLRAAGQTLPPLWAATRAEITDWLAAERPRRTG